MTFVQKILLIKCCWNWNLKSISPTFYKRICANILAPIKSWTFTASTKKLRAKLLYKKPARKMLVKLTPTDTKLVGKMWWSVPLMLKWVENSVVYLYCIVNVKCIPELCSPWTPSEWCSELVRLFPVKQKESFFNDVTTMFFVSVSFWRAYLATYIFQLN